jgi:hypothetical protein
MRMRIAGLRHVEHAVVEGRLGERRPPGTPLALVALSAGSVAAVTIAEVVELQNVAEDCPADVEERLGRFDPPAIAEVAVQLGRVGRVGRAQDGPIARRQVVPGVPVRAPEQAPERRADRGARREREIERIRDPVHPQSAAVGPADRDGPAVPLDGPAMWKALDDVRGCHRLAVDDEERRLVRVDADAVAGDQGRRCRVERDGRPAEDRFLP